MKVLYIDELLLVNFTAGAAFLLAAGLLAGVRCRGGGGSVSPLCAIDMGTRPP